ncbi:carboxylesterase [Marinitoga hydrogenitolerans DSM 16785]|uniref:Carboxylesterase n=1 Tax=Marinitoga hydrogenitolerans (strain DSM 16785 / JCM 12826 / AT1271) TaxID=1122195 RepID=A0A1M4V4F2_MARH1|nr:alpha/beta fold hydrolase [Marinitoga hydrogenitolerans]SHE63854.1 carboxylesterase [Marinitoga hydrogenitolerans DSM 16785]
MFLDHIPENSQIVYEKSYPLLLEGGDIAVLLIHGYTGSPHDMYYLAERLNEVGYTVHVPRLPGHGTNAKDFLNSNWKDWLRKVVDSYIELKSKYKKVYISGLSMGGVLTLLLASKFNPDKIVLAAPALEASDWRLKLTPVIKLFMKKIKKNKKEFYEDGLNNLAREYWDYDWPSKGADLYKLQRLARKRLKKINSDTLIIVSKRDRTVPLKVANVIKSNINTKKVKTIILEKSPHVVVNDIEKEKVADEIIDFFKESEK